MKIFRKNSSVKFWASEIDKAFTEAEKKWKTRRLMSRLNRQSRSIREWDLGESAPADQNGFRLLP